jgi:hypothetical protein
VTLPRLPLLDRPQFFSGQLLDATDLEQLLDYHRQLRWLHNRALHGFGVVAGLAVTGRRGDRDVQLSAGLAIDGLGRELLLSETATGAVPPVAGSGGAPVDYVLAISHARDDELPAETRRGPCSAAGAVRRPERARLRWLQPGEPRPGADIVLAGVQIENCRLAADVSEGPRQEIARAACNVAVGETPEGSTGWRPWPENNVAGFETTITTASAGFAARPVYSVSLLGSRMTSQNDFAVDGQPMVVNATPTSLDVRVVLPGPLALGQLPLNPDDVRDPSFGARLETELGWHVAWMGVEASG